MFFIFSFVVAILFGIAIFQPTADLAVAFSAATFVFCVFSVIWVEHTLSKLKDSLPNQKTDSSASDMSASNEIK